LSKKTKAILKDRAKGRKTINDVDNDTYFIMEEQALYETAQDSLSDNTFYWDIDFD